MFVITSNFTVSIICYHFCKDCSTVEKKEKFEMKFENRISFKSFEFIDMRARLLVVKEGDEVFNKMM